MSKENIAEDKIRILFVLSTLGAGGSESLVLELVSRLDSKRFTTFVYSIYDGELRHSFLERGIRVFVSSKRPGLDLRVMRDVAAVVRANGIHVVNTQHLAPLIYSYWGTKISNRRLLVHTAHACWEMEEMPWYWRRVQRFLFHQTDANVGVIEEVAENFCSSFDVPHKRVYAIPNGVDIKLIQEAQRERVEVRDELGIRPDEIAVGLVGNLREEKNHRVLIEALAILKDRYPYLTLVLAGSGDQEEALRLQVKCLGLENRVKFLGYRSDIYRIYAALDLYCLPSKKEGLSLGLLMALAAKLPTIASDIPANQKIITHRCNGLLVKPDDPREISQAISQVLTQPEFGRQLTEEGFLTVSSKYDVESWAEKYKQLFSSLVRQSSMGG